MKHNTLMTKRNDDDPSGSIFLPKTDRPEEEFERWRQRIIFARGEYQGKQLSPDEVDGLLGELERVRAGYMGRVALAV